MLKEQHSTIFLKEMLGQHKKKLQKKFKNVKRQYQHYQNIEEMLNNTRKMMKDAK